MNEPSGGAVVATRATPVFRARNTPGWRRARRDWPSRGVQGHSLPAV